MIPERSISLEALKRGSVRVRPGFSLLAESAKIHTHPHGARGSEFGARWLIFTFQPVRLGARSPTHPWRGEMI